MIALALLGCSPPPPPPDMVTSGCDWARGECRILEDAPLVAWIETHEPPPVTFEGRDLAAERLTTERVDGGVRLTISAPVEPGRWAFEGVRSFDVTRAQPWVRRDCDEVEGELAEQGTLPDGEAWSAAARCARARGEDGQEARIAYLDKAVEAHLAADEATLAAHASAVLVDVLLDRRDLAGAELALERPLKDDSELIGVDGRWILSNYRARLTALEGQPREARRLDWVALRWAERVQRTVLALRSRQELSILSYQAGDHERAIELLDDTVHLLPECSVVGLFNRRNIIWYELERAVASGDNERVHAARSDLDSLVSLHCDEVAPEHLAELQVDQAVVAWFSGDDLGARGALSRARRTGPLDAVAAAWAALLDAELAGPGDSVEHFRTAIAAGRRAGSGEVGIRASTGQSLVLARRGEADPFHSARSAAVSVARGLPWERERAAWLSSLDGLVGAWISNELESGHPERAVQAIQWANTAVVRSLQATERLEQLAADTAETADTSDTSGAEAARDLASRYWELRAELDAIGELLAVVPEDEVPELERQRIAVEQELAVAIEGQLGEISAALPPPLSVGPDEVVLLGWPSGPSITVFVVTASGVEHTSVSRQATAADWRSLLQPHRDRPLRILGLGPHTSIAEQALVDATADRPVTWSLGLVPSMPPAVRPTGRRLVVADPLNDLPHAREELDRVARPGDVVLTGADATVEAVLEAMATVDTVHFAVHGQHDPDQPVASALLLADGTLRASDIVAAPRVPKAVFLSGCETGRSRFSLGLAQAFVAAGAEAVVASDRVVDDGQTPMLVEALYDRSIAGGTAFSAEALATARTRLSRRRPDGDWSSWRLWTP